MKLNRNAASRFSAYSAHARLTVSAIHSSTFFKDIRMMNRYSGAVKCFAASCALSILPLASFAQNYVQTNLVSDIPQVPNADGTSVTIDPHLKNVWGMSRGEPSPWWGGNNVTATSPLYPEAALIAHLFAPCPNAMVVTTP